MAKGPLAVRWGEWTLDDPHAGAVGRARVELENAGTVAWRDGIRLAYHWLDDRGNPIVWDGERTPLPELAPGERATVEAARARPDPARPLPLRARPRRRPPRLVLGARQRDGRGRRRRAPARRHAPRRAAGLGRADGRGEERIAAAHAEGYAVVAGAIEWLGGSAAGARGALAPYEPGPGRIPDFAHPLLCPSVLDGVELERLEDVAGLPAFAAPAEDAWLYDGRIVLRAQPKRRESAPG